MLESGVVLLPPELVAREAEEGSPDNRHEGTSVDYEWLHDWFRGTQELKHIMNRSRTGSEALPWEENYLFPVSVTTGTLRGQV